MLVQHAGLRPGIDHGGDVFRGDLVDVLGGHAEHVQGGVGGAVEHIDQRLEDLDEREHRPDHHQRAGLWKRHGDALGDQVGELDEEQGDDQERADIGDALGSDHVQVGQQRRLQQVGDMLLADDTGQDGHAVDADLHDGEEVARLLLEQHDLGGAAVATLRQHLQLGAARCGQRDLGNREEGADQDKEKQDKGEHRFWGAPFRRFDDGARCTVLSNSAKGRGRAARFI